jgi:transketolase
MRTAFVQGLCQLAERDGRVMLLTADLGWSVLEPFANRFPDRFINVGVAEQNMLGLATGLALEGRVPFVYSIATFASMRCYEQFRNGPVLHRLPVRVVGTGGGFAYGHAGPTHHALEDLAIARALPTVNVLAPADGAQTRSILAASMAMPGPVYLRIDKSEDADLPTLAGEFALGEPNVVRPGGDVLFLATGSIVREALAAAERLEGQGIFAAVAAVPHLAGSASLAELIGSYPDIASLEEATVCGGLGSLVAETIADGGLSCRLLRLGVRAGLDEHSGSRPYLLRMHGLDAESVAAQTLEFIRPRTRRERAGRRLRLASEMASEAGR